MPGFIALLIPLCALIVALSLIRKYVPTGKARVRQDEPSRSPAVTAELIDLHQRLLLLEAQQAAQQQQIQLLLETRDIYPQREHRPAKPAD